MAKYRLTSPDGGTFEITAPDDATPEQVISYAQSQWKAPEQPKEGRKRGFGENLALGTRNAIEGLVNTAGIVTDPVGAILNAALGTNIRPYRESVPEALTSMGFPKPENEQERMVARVSREMVGLLPTIGAGMAARGAQGAGGAVARALAEKPVVQMAGATGSALAGQAAAEAGASPAMEGLAALGGSLGGTLAAEGLGAIGRGASAALQPFTQGGRERIVADTMLRSSGAPDELAERIALGLEDTSRRLPGSPVTTAQAARDPGLMVLESGLRSDAQRTAGQGGMSGAVAFRDVEAQRNAARQGFMQSMADDLTPEARGETVRGILRGEEALAIPGGASSFVASKVSDATKKPLSFYGNLENLSRQRADDAAPLYEKAFSKKPVYSDRTKAFLDDPITRTGLSRGLEIQRLEALRDNIPFNPKDYAIIGFNPAGDPIIGGVPNMRLLDAAKRGLDDIIEQYRDKTSGILRLDQRGRAIDGVRKSLVSHLDVLNPDYKAARQSWSGPSQSMDALEMGRKAVGKDPEIVKKQFDALSPGDKEYFKAGMVRDITDSLSGKGPQQVYSYLQKNGESLRHAFGKQIDESIATIERVANRFGRDESGTSAVGNILKTDQFGAPQIPSQNVAGQALANPNALQQTLKAAGKQAPQVKAALRGQFVENMLSATKTTGGMVDAAGNVSDAMSPANFKRFFDKNAPIAKELFDEPGQFLALQRLANDFAETQISSLTAKARGSDTAQNLSVGNLIARASNGLIEPSGPLAQTLVGIGPVMRLIYSAPEASIREMLVEAAREPKFAKILLEKAGPQSAQRASEYLNSTMGQRLRDSLGATAARIQQQQQNSMQNGGMYGGQ